MLTTDLSLRRRNARIRRFAVHCKQAFGMLKLPCNGLLRVLRQPRSSVSCVNPLKGGQRASFAALTAVAGLVACTTVQACSTVSREIPIDEDVTVNYVSEPDAFLTNVHTGRNGLFTGCRAATYDVNIQANLPGLTYVRDVELFGLSVPAYELHPGSPLVGIVAIIENSGSPTGRLPLSMGPNTTQYTTRSGSFGLDFSLYTRLFARGGPTSGAPYGNLGTIEITLQQAPGLSVTVPVSLGIQMRSPTCTIGDNSVVLDNVSADALPAVGRPIGEKTFNMQMNCLTAGANVTLQIVDALDSGNVGSRLTPTSDSDARGVDLELLRGGNAVRFGETWDHGPSRVGMQNIPFSARYVRNAEALEPGEIKGQATLSLDYN